MKQSSKQGGLWNPDPRISFLNPSKLIDSDHPDILAKSREMTAGSPSMEKAAEALFLFVRDAIRYAMYFPMDERDYRASSILKKRVGFCTTKAILLCALFRAVKIPAGIAIYDMIDHTIDTDAPYPTRDQRIRFHGVAALFYGDRFYPVDVTLDKVLAVKKRLSPVAFSAGQACLMPALNQDVKPGVSYVRLHKLYADLRFKEIEAWYLKPMKDRMKKGLHF